MGEPVVSIIIPCYNSVEFLPDTIESVKHHNNVNIYEIIVVNDGSTDFKTNEYLDKLKVEGITVIHQENKGPAAARNTGIRNSRGKYIMLLDSDNKIKPEYIDRGIEILDSYPDVGIVYGKPVFFGDSTEKRFDTKPFDLKTIFHANYIDNCVVLRKATWNEVGEFDEERLLISHEDWDYWIRVGRTNWKFHYLDQFLFYYRIRQGSLVQSQLAKIDYHAIKKYIYSKHLDLLIKLYDEAFEHQSYFLHNEKKPLRTVFKYLYKAMKTI